MQVDPIRLTLKVPRTKRLKLTCDQPLAILLQFSFNFDFKFNLRRYIMRGVRNRLAVGESPGIDDILDAFTENQEEVAGHNTASPKFATPPPKLLGLVAKAVSEWQMIVPGDKVLLGLSGRGLQLYTFRLDVTTF